MQSPAPVSYTHLDVYKRQVDGGVVSPVPVDAARDLGAEFVIAVDISSKANGVADSASLLGLSLIHI